MILSCFLGAGVGMISGLVSRRSIKKSLFTDNTSFFRVMAAGAAIRLLFAAGLLIGLTMTHWPHAIALVLSLIAVQTAVQAIPIRTGR